ncbi:MAG: CDP-alcohol phosphatidyltransferase family protein [Angustibacter sp.]
MPSLGEYLASWQRLHGTDPRASRLVHGWLRGSYLLARPLARRRVAPNAVTVLGVVVAATVVPLALAGGRWPLLAAPVVVVSGVVDNLDGAVAVLTGRTSRWGALADALADRVSDAGYVLALWALGAPAWLAVLAGGLGFLHEYARARAGALGLPDAATITVAERPTRVVGATMFLLAAGIYPGSAAPWATAGAAFGVAVGVVGLVQLLPALRRRLLDDHVK